MNGLPTGTVTFLFTDIEGSSRLLQELAEEYSAAQEDHARIMRSAIAAGGGREIRTEGDSFFAVFPSALGALRAAIAAQRGLASHEWASGRPLRVRMGLHTGEGRLGGDDYLSIDVNRAARIADAAHGGQVLLSSSTAPLVVRDLPEGVTLRSLGQHRLKDFDHPEDLHQVAIEGLPDRFPELRTLDVRPTNLPTPRTSFVGRGDEVVAVLRALREARLVTLSGPGGTGKTRLAIHAAGRVQDDYPDGVFFVDLSPIVDPGLVPSAVAEALKVVDTSARSTLDVLSDHLSDRKLLLVLDNFERVTDAAGVVERLMDAAPELRVLVTSRSPLHLSGERELPVPPLELPGPDVVRELEALSRCEAVALFIDRATSVRPTFRITNENAPAVAELVAHLDGLPLAVELAASRIKLLTPEALLARLGQRLSLLAKGARDVPERQRTLRAAIEWSHDLLDVHERRLFARLAVFAGGWTTEAADWVCGNGEDVLEGLSSLIDKSLIRRVDDEGGEPRFSMLETIGEYAAERLEESGEEDETRRRHAEFFRTLAEEAGAQLGPDPIGALGRLDGEIDNLRRALAWAIAVGEPEIGLSIASAIWRFWLHRGLLAEGRSWLERLLAAPAAAGRTLVRARALEALGSLAYWQNDYAPTRSAYDEAESIAREIGDRALLAQVLWDQSYMAGVDGDFGHSQSLLLEGLEAADDAGDPKIAALIRLDLGMITGRDDPAAGVESLRKGVAVLEELGMAAMLPDYLGGLSLMELRVGRLEEARGHMRRAMEIAVATGSDLGIGEMLWGMALLAVAEGQHERAARLLGGHDRILGTVGAAAPAELQMWFGDPADDARKALGPEAYERAHAEGSAMETAALVAYASGD